MLLLHDIGEIDGETAWSSRRGNGRNGKLPSWRQSSGALGSGLPKPALPFWPCGRSLNSGSLQKLDLYTRAIGSVESELGTVASV
jgi:hypothetical protein